MSCVELNELKLETENLWSSAPKIKLSCLICPVRGTFCSLWHVKSVRSSQKSRPCQAFTVKIGIDYSGQLQTRHLNALPLFSSIKDWIWSFKGSQCFMVLKPCSLPFYQIHAPRIRVEVFVPACLWTGRERCFERAHLVCYNEWAFSLMLWIDPCRMSK